MISYRTNEGNKVIVIRDKCRCINKRIHIFAARVDKFFCCFDGIGWYQGLRTIASITIAYGIIHFLFYQITALRSNPARINSLFLFPWISFMHYVETAILLFSAATLLIGVQNGNLQKIRNYPWLMLSCYFFAAFHLWNLFWQGNHIALALAFSDFGMKIKTTAEKDWKIIRDEKISLYIFLSILILVDIFLPTYLIILSLSLIDKLEYEMESECFGV